MSVQEALNFQSPFADSVGLVPVDLSTPQRSAQQSNGSITLQFPPASAAVSLPQILQPPDAATGRDDLDVCDLADDLKHPEPERNEGPPRPRLSSGQPMGADDPWSTAA